MSQGRVNVELILEKIENLSGKLEAHTIINQEANTLILEQVKRTNGRVTSLEKWRYTIAGGILVLTAFLGIITTKISIALIN